MPPRSKVMPCVEVVSGPYASDVSTGLSAAAKKSLARLSSVAVIVDTARAEGLSIRQLIARVVTARGHKTIIGTPAQVADLLEDWFRAGAADGFNILAPTLPHGLTAFAELVVPELQRRGLFRTDYEAATLREHLGLAIPGGARIAEAAE